MYEIDFLGLINFFELENGEPGRRVLIPDGTPERKGEVDPDDKIVPHFASILVRTDDILDDTKWAARGRYRIFEEEVVAQFRIDKPSTIIISGMDAPAVKLSSSESASGEPASCEPAKIENGVTFNDSDFDGKSIKLRKLFEEIDIDRNRAATIAEIPIRRGRLVSSRLANTLAAQLFVDDHEGNVTITAYPKDKSDPKSLTLQDRTTFVIVNMSNDLAGDATEDPEKSHFRLYAQLDSQRRADELPDPTLDEINALDVAEIVSSHPFVEHLRTLSGPGVPEGQCTVTGCCDPSECRRPRTPADMATE
ncbi:MAG TPA: hypothetical protein VF432_32915 [Thermoanaerobaculia bacterium]